jgi:hypothetical protein
MASSPSDLVLIKQILANQPVEALEEFREISRPRRSPAGGCR